MCSIRLCCRNFISGYNRHAISSITRRNHSLETSQISLQVAALRASNHPFVRSLVLQISTILPRSRRDDARAWSLSGPYNCLRLCENSTCAAPIMLDFFCKTRLLLLSLPTKKPPALCYFSDHLFNSHDLHHPLQIVTKYRQAHLRRHLLQPP